jgi:uncharacterized protein YaiI (UPF0178 family)
MRLLNLSLSEINQLISKLEKDSKAIKSELLKLCWHMRGGLTLTEAYSMDLADREIINSIIEENIKVTKDTGLPFF